MNSFNNNALMAFSTLSLININLLVNTIIFLEREKERKREREKERKREPRNYLYISMLNSPFADIFDNIFRIFHCRCIGFFTMLRFFLIVRLPV